MGVQVFPMVPGERQPRRREQIRIPTDTVSYATRCTRLISPSFLVLL